MLLFKGAGSRNVSKFKQSESPVPGSQLVEKARKSGEDAKV